MTRLRTLIVEDELLDRERLRDLLSHEADVEVVGECGDRTAALDIVTTARPDLVFLDVRTLGPDAFDEFVSTIEQVNSRAMVILTAQNELSFRSFDKGVDYLLKPVSHERLRKAIERAKGGLPRDLPNPSPESGDARVDARFQAGTTVYTGPARRLAIRVGTRLLVIRTLDIVWIEAADNYVRVHTEKESHLYRARITDLASILDAEQFIRIHRSIIVNIDHVRAIDPWGAAGYVLILTDGTKLASSRRYHETIRSTFGC